MMVQAVKGQTCIILLLRSTPPQNGSFLLNPAIDEQVVRLLPGSFLARKELQPPLESRE